MLIFTLTSFYFPHIVTGVKVQAGDLSFSIGTSSSVNKVNSIAIGSCATATRYNSVAIVAL